MDYFKTQKTQHQQVYLNTLKSVLSKEELQFIDRWVDWNEPGDIAVMDTSSHINLVNVRPESGEDEIIDCVINIKPLNDIRYVNKFMEAVNEKLKLHGIFMGCVETSGQRRKRLMAKFRSPFNAIYFFFDYFLKRVWPKLPYLKRLYFLLTGGRNRVISEMETYGRLYSCGFRLVEAKAIRGKLYFLAQKQGYPDYNTGATYGPLVGLRRIGKGGKMIKVYKMRTMYPYSEYLQQFIYEREGLTSGGKFKDDPRINYVGKFMRKYWLDELPMLYNWLRGDMKFFGVRPISRQYMSLYPAEFQEFRKKFKPGLIPPVYVEIPETLEDVVDIERRYLEAYQRNPLLTDLQYTGRALYNIFIKSVRSK